MAWPSLAQVLVDLHGPGPAGFPKLTKPITVAEAKKADETGVHLFVPLFMLALIALTLLPAGDGAAEAQKESSIRKEEAEHIADDNVTKCACLLCLHFRLFCVLWFALCVPSSLDC